MEYIYAGIVTYNPDIKRLKENINSIIDQVETLVIVDNNSDNIKCIEKICDKFKNTIIIIKNKNNYGIAKALNQIMRYSLDAKCEWVLLLDQDSVCPENIINEFIKYTKEPLVAIISPNIRDINSNYNLEYKSKFEYVSQCITSGSFTKTSIWNKIGRFDENLFIDCVDDDYCIRLYNEGYKVIRVNDITLLHEIGKKTTHRLFSTYNHSAFRKYYMTRNTLYCARKYSKYSKHKYKTKKEIQDYNKRFNGLTSVCYSYMRIFKRVIIVIIYEDDKINKIKAMLKGIKDSLHMTINV